MEYIWFFLFILDLVSTTPSTKEPLGQCRDIGRYTPIPQLYKDKFWARINDEVNHRSHEPESGPGSLPSAQSSDLSERGGPEGSLQPEQIFEISSANSEPLFRWRYSNNEISNMERVPLQVTGGSNVEDSYNPRTRNPSLLHSISRGFCGWAIYCAASVRNIPNRLSSGRHWASIFFQNLITFWLYADPGQEQARKDKFIALLSAYVVAGTILVTNLYSAWANNRPRKPEKFTISMEIYHRNGDLPPGAPKPRFKVDEFNIQESGDFAISGHSEIPLAVSYKSWLQNLAQPSKPNFETSRSSSGPFDSEPPPSSPDAQSEDLNHDDYNLSRRDGGEYDNFCAPESWKEWQTILSHVFWEIVVPMMRDGVISVTLALAHWGTSRLFISNGGQTLVRWWLSEIFHHMDFRTLQRDEAPRAADLVSTNQWLSSPATSRLYGQECFERWKPPELYAKYDAGPPQEFWEAFKDRCVKFNDASLPDSSRETFQFSGYGWKAEYFPDGCRGPVNCTRLIGSSKDGHPKSEVTSLIDTCKRRNWRIDDGAFSGGLLSHNGGPTGKTFMPCGTIRIQPWYDS